MGVPFHIVLYATSEAEARQAAFAAFRRVKELNAIMSDYEPDSELNRLARTAGRGQTVVLSPDLWEVLDLSQRVARQSDGAFDITIGPCVSLWRQTRRTGRWPAPEKLAEARSQVGYTNLVLDARQRTALLRVPGMRLDLGGIGKGYAADAALKVLRDSGHPRALVAASGDIAIGDAPPGRRGWNVELIGTDYPGGPAPMTVELARAGVSTSGDLSQFVVIDGVRYSHVLDPFTCIGLTNHALATVVARDCTTADALDTTLTLVPPKKAMSLARQYRIAVRIFEVSKNATRTVSNARFQSLRAL
jgi:FAD:protein FMN transferase